MPSTLSRFLSVLLVISLVISAIVASLAIVCLSPISLGVVAAVHPQHTPAQADAQRQIAKGALAYVTLGIMDPTFDTPLFANEEAYRELGIQQFGLDEVRHLTDVRHTITTTWVIGLAAAICAGICAVLVGSDGGVPRAASFKVAGWLCIGLPVAIAAALLVAFDWFFTLFHQVLYPQGNWQFAWDSALIYSFPEQYWSTMGLLWMLTIVLLGITFLISSGVLRTPSTHRLR